jgi:hypothetical protein
VSRRKQDAAALLKLNSQPEAAHDGIDAEQMRKARGR